MTHGPAPNEGLGNLGHVDGALDAGRNALLLERVLESQGVNDRRQHAHVISGGPLNTLLAALKASKDIAAADHDDDFDTQFLDLGDLASHVVHGLRVDALSLDASECLTAEFEEDSAVTRLGCYSRFLHRRSVHISQTIPSSTRWHPGPSETPD